MRVKFYWGPLHGQERSLDDPPRRFVVRALDGYGGTELVDVVYTRVVSRNGAVYYRYSHSEKDGRKV